MNPLRNATFRTLFAAQVVALVGTGLLTVALGLLAWEIAGADAGAVLGTALAIKMIAYVGVAPIAGALAERLPRRPLLIGLDIVRGAVALLLPFIDQVWQIYVLIFVLQSASAAFTPAFQATIPDVLPDEDDYTQALSLSRLAYDLESLLSPALAAALLALMSFHWLFAGTVVGFLVSALLVGSVLLPSRTGAAQQASFLRRTTRGARIYLATPRLRGLLALNLAAAAAGAFVIVNSVVLVRSMLGGSESDVAVVLASFGGGSMAAALLLPKLLKRIPDRTAMLAGGVVLIAGLVITGALLITGATPWAAVLGLWLVMGLGYSAVLTPAGRLIRRSCQAQDRPALFAAQFALSHACWLVTYPLAGRMGAETDLGPTAFLLAAIGLVGILVASRVWPKSDPVVIAHAHPELAVDDPHLAAPGHSGGKNAHAHPYVIDDRHPRWPH